MPRGCRSPTTCTRRVCVPLGLGATRLDGHPGSGAVSTCADLARFAAELQAPTLVDPSTARRGRHRRLSGAGRDPARLRAPATQRLGPGVRDPRREVAALDGQPQLTAHVRALRAVRDVPVGRPGRGSGVRRADRPRLRTSGRSRRGRRSRTGFSRPWNGSRDTSERCATRTMTTVCRASSIHIGPRSSPRLALRSPSSSPVSGLLIRIGFMGSTAVMNSTTAAATRGDSRCSWRRAGALDLDPMACSRSLRQAELFP